MGIPIIAGICIGFFFLLALLLWFANRRGGMTTIANFATVMGAVMMAIGLTITIYPPRIGEKCSVNVEIVLDCSIGMSEGIVGGGTKYDEAILELDRILYSFSDGDNLALRRFGGPSCDAGATAPLVELGKKNRDKVQETATNQVLEGQASLARAVIEATGEFNDPAKFGGMRNRIIVILGSGDFCRADPSQLIRERLQDIRDDIALSFSFIGDSIPVDVQDELRQIAEETGGPKELRDVQQIIPDDVSERIGTLPTIDPEIIDGIMTLGWRTGDSDDVLHTLKVEKIMNERDPQNDYYVVTTVATQKQNSGQWFTNIVRLWTSSERGSETRRAQIIDFQPRVLLPSLTPVTVDMAGASISFVTDSPGVWEVEQDYCDSGEWKCSEIVWAVPFELTYCWRELRTVSIWSAPADAVKILEISSQVITAVGNCAMVSTTETTANRMETRVDLSELERQLGEL